MMRRVLALAAAIVAVLAAPATAPAGWMPARTVDAAHDGGAVPAVNARGDVALLWTGRGDGALRATVLRATGERSTRVLTRRAAGEPTVVVDRSGRATAAWLEGERLYAASGSASGRWSAPQLIARRRAAGPELAVSPDRRVLLVWTNLSDTGPGSTGVAWREPGRAFTASTRLARPAPGLMPGEAPQSDNGVTFDARGRAYLWSTCDGVLRVARAGSRSLRLVRVTAGRALGLYFSVTPSGRGLATWADSRCTTDPAAGSEPGPVHVRAFRSGAFGPRLDLTGASGEHLTGRTTGALALPGAGALVLAFAESRPVQVGLDADGVQQSVSEVADWRIPFAADAGGSVILPAPHAGLVVRNADGSEEPLPDGGPASAAAVPNGRGFAAVWAPDERRLRVALWRP
jgi:hypothetical protein